MKMFKVVITGSIVGLMISSSVSAADLKTSLGLGVGMAPDYEGSEDYEAVPLPYARVSWDDSGKYVLLEGESLRANLLSDNWQLGPMLQYRKGRDDVDNDKVDKMKDIDDAVEAGMFLAYKTGQWKFGIDAIADISDEHDGYLVTLRGAYTFDISSELKLTPVVSTTYADDDYMETYFQVDGSNVGSSGLDLYEADSGIKDVAVSLVADYEINEQWSLLGIAKYTQLLDDAKDSPVVDDEGDDGQMFIGMMGIYHFN